MIKVCFRVELLFSCLGHVVDIPGKPFSTEVFRHIPMPVRPWSVKTGTVITLTMMSDRAMFEMLMILCDICHNNILIH